MRRVIIICEGNTEQEFCRDLLAPKFADDGIIIETPLIKRSHGGIVPWDILKKQILNHLCEEDAYVTMLVDYYGIKDNFKFPGWEESKVITDKSERMHFLFSKMKETIPAKFRVRFIPYIQLHEFEGLLFSKIDVILNNFDKSEVKYSELQAAADSVESPEYLNDGPFTAPSKRLERAIPSYSKVLFGNCLAMDITLDVIRCKCHLFNEWVGNIEKIGVSQNV